jgi:hypothetical protein
MSEFKFNQGVVPVARGANSSQSLDSRISSQRSSSHRPDGKKEKRQPSITPRRFNRFFTPQSHGRLVTSSSRAALEDITGPANNRNGTQSSPIRPSNNGTGTENSPTAFTREMKRRKLLHTPSPSPEEFGPEKRYLFNQLHALDDNTLEEHYPLNSSQLSTTTEDTLDSRKQELPQQNRPIRHIKQLDARGFAGRFLQLSLGTSKYQRLKYPTNGQYP